MGLHTQLLKFMEMINVKIVMNKISDVHTCIMKPYMEGTRKNVRNLGTGNQAQTETLWASLLALSIMFTHPVPIYTISYILIRKLQTDV